MLNPLWASSASRNSTAQPGSARPPSSTHTWIPARKHGYQSLIAPVLVIPPGKRGVYVSVDEAGLAVAQQAARLHRQSEMSQAPQAAATALAHEVESSVQTQERAALIAIRANEVYRRRIDKLWMIIRYLLCFLLGISVYYMLHDEVSIGVGHLCLALLLSPNLNRHRASLWASAAYMLLCFGVIVATLIAQRDWTGSSGLAVMLAALLAYMLVGATAVGIFAVQYQHRLAIHRYVAIHLNTWRLLEARVREIGEMAVSRASTMQASLQSASEQLQQSQATEQARELAGHRQWPTPAPPCESSHRHGPATVVPVALPSERASMETMPMPTDLPALITLPDYELVRQCLQSTDLPHVVYIWAILRARRARWHSCTDPCDMAQVQVDPPGLEE